MALASPIGGPSGSIVYGGSILRALAIALCLSWVAMQVIALFIERRTDLLHPSTQFKSFWFGDLICLPGLVLVFWKMSQRLPEGSHYWQRGWWHMLALIAGIAVGVTFHYVLDANAYSAAQLVSPTKLYHDLIVYPLYIYVLFSGGVPCLVHSGWGIRGAFDRGNGSLLCIGFVLFFTAFLGLLGYDGSHEASKAHVPWSWSQFSSISVSIR